jgi:hypothetical protein
MVNLGERSARTGPAADVKNTYIFQCLVFVADRFWRNCGTFFLPPRQDLPLRAIEKAGPP